MHKEYLDLLEKEITRAFVYSYQEQAEALFQNYLDHAEAYVNKTKVRDRNTKEELPPDEGFLKSIEEQIAIIGSAADGFRQEVIAYLWATSRRGEKVSYKSYEPLKEAIEKKLMTSVRDISRIITKARTRDEEQSEKYSSMVKNLVRERILRILRGRGPEVRGQQPLEGLTRPCFSPSYLVPLPVGERPGEGPMPDNSSAPVVDSSIIAHRSRVALKKDPYPTSSLQDGVDK